MPRFRYAGPDPVPGDDGEIVRPGEVREMDQPPDWGPWEPVPDDPGDQDEPLPLDVPVAAPAPVRRAAPAAAAPPAPGKEGE